MRTILRIWDRLEEMTAVLLFAAMIFFGTCQVLFRFVVNLSLDWTEELTRFAFIFLVYISASLCAAKNRHVRVEIIDLLLPKGVLSWLHRATLLVWAAFAFIIAYSGWENAVNALEIGETSAVLELPMGWILMIIPVGLFLMGARLLVRIAESLCPRTRANGDKEEEPVNG
ncbi:MAG: TRAP transporter small permease [Planctomycetota bacterium]|jgi:TRAP-type C4-dicarboxylate transport system permease small subunit|nr:TRAP transporter small permease [Planctomycetota bacterium]